MRSAITNARFVEKPRLKQQGNQRHDDDLRREEQGDDANQLADVDRSSSAWRQQQCAQRVAISLALERPAERERARERNGNPQDTGRRVSECAAVSALPDKRDGKHHDTRDREEHRRVEQLAASGFDRKIFSRDYPDDAPEGAHDATPACRRS